MRVNQAAPEGEINQSKCVIIWPYRVHNGPQEFMYISTPRIYRLPQIIRYAQIKQWIKEVYTVIRV